MHTWHLIGLSLPVGGGFGPAGTGMTSWLQYAVAQHGYVNWNRKKVFEHISGDTLKKVWLGMNHGSVHNMGIFLVIECALKESLV